MVYITRNKDSFLCFNFEIFWCIYHILAWKVIMYVLFLFQCSKYDSIVYKVKMIILVYDSLSETASMSKKYSNSENIAQ
jgi:hypothetical protein